MKFVINIILTILFAIALHFLLPWWSVMLAAFLAGAIVRQKKAAVFFAPFLAIALLWWTNATLIVYQADDVLVTKVATLFPLGGNTFLLILITGLIGGIAAGVAGVSGQQFRKLLVKEERKYKYH